MKAILFDLDRTLLDVDPVYKKCYSQMNHLLTKQTVLNLSDEEFKNDSVKLEKELVLILKRGQGFCFYNI